MEASHSFSFSGEGEIWQQQWPHFKAWGPADTRRVCWKRCCITVRLCCYNVDYYSTVMTFYRIRARERTKYASVLHYTIPVWPVFVEGGQIKNKNQWNNKPSTQLVTNLYVLPTKTPNKVYALTWIFSYLCTSSVRGHWEESGILRHGNWHLWRGQWQWLHVGRYEAFQNS